MSVSLSLLVVNNAEHETHPRAVCLNRDEHCSRRLSLTDDIPSVLHDESCYPQQFAAHDAELFQVTVFVLLKD